jgi:hypothetical protein
MATLADARVFNQTVLDQLGTPGMEKQAIDAIQDFTRWKMREDGFFRRILTPLPIGNSDLVRQVDTDEPVMVVDREPDSPAAISVAFGELPANIYIKGPRYRVFFDRILTPRFTKDIDQLRTYVMDIRQILSDNAIKDMLAEEDSKFLSAVNTALVGQDQVCPLSGVPQWQSISGGITRDTWQDAKKILPRTPSHLEVNTVLMNNITIREFLKWGRDEYGGDMAQDLAKNGWSEMEYDNSRIVITIKRDLVPDDSMYFFGPTNFIGKFYTLEDATMYIKREAFLLEFFSYESIGAAIGNTNSIARADFV